MTTEEIAKLYEELFIKHGQNASIIFQAVILERLAKRIEDALARLSDE